MIGSPIWNTPATRQIVAYVKFWDSGKHRISSTERTIPEIAIARANFGLAVYCDILGGPEVKSKKSERRFLFLVNHLK